jgi:hypothetical protein
MVHRRADILAMRCVSTLWASMHQALLLEFDREVPVLPLSKYLDDHPSVADKLIEGSLTDDDLSEEQRRQRDRLLKKPKRPTLNTVDRERVDRSVPRR